MNPPSLIAHYRITAKLGEGGMGEVWRATDTKLNRDVALKILPEAFATDRDRMARFEREAQVLASLNHPNMAAVHGVEARCSPPTNQAEIPPTTNTVGLLLTIAKRNLDLLARSVFETRHGFPQPGDCRFE